MNKREDQIMMANRKLFRVICAFALTAGFVFYWASPALATTYYVSPGPGTPIQDAIDGASYGDTVEVSAGTYMERITLKNGVAVIGEVIGNDPNNTIIDGNDTGSVVTSNNCDPNTLLDGFTITNGNAAGGGGMYNSGNSPTVTNCTFSGNSADYNGGGMYNSGSSPTVTNCTFSGNSTADYDGGGMYNSSSSSTVTNCTFSGNTANDYGGGMHNYFSSPTVTNCTFSGNRAYDDGGGGMCNGEDSSPTVTNCTFSGNTAYDGGGMYNSFSSPTVTNCTFSGNTANDDNGGGMFNNSTSSPTVTNCTFSGNTSYDGGGGMHNEGSSPTVTNCILWANTHPQIYAPGGTPSVTYCDVQGGYTGTGNINADPLFIDADGPDDIIGTEDDNLHLSPGSPCIDAGDNDSVPSGVTTDLDGNSRFFDDLHTPDTGNGTSPIVDMGAYEYTPVIYVDESADGTNNGSSWFDAFNHLQDGLAAADYGDSILVAEGTYRPDQDTANPTGTGLRTDTFALISGVAIYGGFPSGGSDFADRNPNQYETILSGDLLENDGPDFANNDENSYHVVITSSVDPNAILDGFTITGGNADGFVLNERGGGIYNENGSPTIKNCIFRNNYANHGGGMNNRDASYPLLIECTFTQNSAGSNGGGIYNYNSGPTLLNCALYGNTAAWNGGGINNNNFQDFSVTIVINSVFSGNSTFNRGGGIFNLNNDCMVTNTGFYGNSAGNYGGAVTSQSSDPVITNCVLWGNWDIDSTEQRGQVYTESGTLNINHSCVKGWDGTLGGVGNIGADPLFKDADGDDDIAGTEDDNLELGHDSPCIDAGDSNSVPADYADLDEDSDTSEKTPLDLAGNARFTDDPVMADTGTGTPPIVDMGAYERYQFCGSAEYPYPPGDVDHNCIFNLADLAIMVQYWLQYLGPE